MPARKRQIRLRGLRPEPLAQLRRELRETGASDRVAELESALRDAENRASDAEHAAERERAESENVRRRTARDREQFRATAIEGLLRDLIPIFDDFERARGAIPADDQDTPIAQGVRMISAQFLASLESRGVSRITPAANDPYDPTLHEAIEAVEPVGDQEEGLVVQCIRDGFSLNGLIVRPAAVVVTKRSSAY